MNHVSKLSGAGTSKQRLRTWLRLLRATRVIESDLRDRLRVRHNSTLPRFDVLATLDRHPDGLRMSEVSAHLKVSNGNVTGIVDRLVSENLAQRISVKDDRRAMRVRLTEQGRKRFAEMAQEHEGWVDAILSDFDADELEMLISLLSRVKEKVPA